MQLTMIQTPISSDGAQSTGSNMDFILEKIWNKPNAPLEEFFEMWYNVFLWAMFSSIFIHSVAAIIAFLTLRKHAVGRFYSIIILLMGVVTPLTTGAVTSAVVSFVYENSGLVMARWHVALWGVGQTFCGACFGFTRILAVL
ncbi:transmembrane protein 170A [Daphnia magna]|uniref:Transmembrane protein 170A n=1 Tax=Daphnia magna TaxID=35525 RepID=A0ABQ9Z609_9CRUS|nr:transmembrane protein 170A [Daphnia magna]XP_032785455.1 transmembrane protein 170A [Daphnia magna]XP_032785459.1 transmembrane protein 170A [Daphnia magna]XP_045030497.1 transmembrane protein 170A [Daphnia magna]KAK4008339.1 hypothetical protein OUZ56_013481 [Daphnia magna]